LKLLKKDLIEMFLRWEKEHGASPTKKQWHEDKTLPSEMPIRMNFGNWTNFMVACGKTPRKSKISEAAMKNSILARTGKTGGNNRGGRIIDRFGYVQVWAKDHPNCKSSGYVHEHRIVMSKHLGRPLLKGENIHHINGDRSDNRIENLELWTTQQPSGQRVEDKISWAKDFLEKHGYVVHENPELLNAR